MSENRWIKRVKLSVLCIVGVSAVSIPVTAPLLSSAMGDGSPMALGSPTRVPPTRENPAKAITESLTCTPEKGHYALRFDDRPYGETSPATDEDIGKSGLVPALDDGRENTTRVLARTVSEIRRPGTCPGLPPETDDTVVSAHRNTEFDVIAVSPRNDGGLAGLRG
jgi:hypothetical protein